MSKRVAIATVIALAVGWLWPGRDLTRDRGDGGGRVLQPTRLGPTAGSAPVAFTLVLRMRDRAIDRHVRDVNDPASARFRRYLTPSRFGTRFGISRPALRRVERVARSAGLEITHSYPQRTQLDLRGQAAQVNRFLRTRIDDFLAADGRRFHSPRRPPRVPGSLRNSVAWVAGLDTRLLRRPAAIPLEGLTPESAAAAYNVAPLRARGLLGQGHTIAIISYDTFDPKDLARFDSFVGIKNAPPVKRIPVQGGVDAPGEGQGEVNLDIDVIRGLAPKAQILNFEAPNPGPLTGTVLNRIVEDGRAQIVSLSWGNCEVDPDMSPADIRADERAFQAAAARGITVFVASGDRGAYDCQTSYPEDLRLSVDWPSASPHVVAVGGTLLSVRRDNTYLSESGWEDVLSGWGGGGGLSATQARPGWQRGPGLSGGGPTAKRAVPDVAATASSDSGFLVESEGERQKFGGTSAAAPFWAGAMILVSQLAEREGVGRLSYLNPIFYRLAGRPDSAFHDVVRGGNRYHNAGPGWDSSTGLGSPDVAKLAEQIVDVLQR